MSKTKEIEIEGLGIITLSALPVGWLEENMDALSSIGVQSSTKEQVGAAMRIVHASIAKKHQDITMEKLKDTLILPEVMSISMDVMTMSGLHKGGAMPENPSQGSSSAS